MPEAKVDLEKCTGFGTCVTTCHIEVFEMKIDDSEKSKLVGEDQRIGFRT